jgi:hypothetical protein
MEVMDSNYMKMHLVVDRYLQGFLQDHEKAEFEERLLWDEELMDELDLAERLRDGLRASARQPARVTARPGIAHRLSSFLYVPQYAAAVSFAFAVALTTTLFMSQLTWDEQPSVTYTGQTEIIPLISTRSDDVQTAYVDQEKWVVLLVDDTGSYDSYRVTVNGDRAEAEPVWTGDGITATYPAISMPGTVLGPGAYVLTLEGELIGDSGEPSYEHVRHVRFRVAPAD